MADLDALGTAGDKTVSSYKFSYSICGIVVFFLLIAAMGGPAWIVSLAYTLSWLMNALGIFATTMMALVLFCLVATEVQIIKAPTANDSAIMTAAESIDRSKARRQISYGISVVIVLLLFLAGFSGIGAVYLVNAVALHLCLAGTKAQIAKIRARQQAEAPAA